MVRSEGVWPQARQTGQRQQADRDQTTKTQQHVDSLGLLELGSLDLTAGFEALMELLNTPALFMPLNTRGLSSARSTGHVASNSHSTP